MHKVDLVRVGERDRVRDRGGVFGQVERVKPRMDARRAI